MADTTNLHGRSLRVYEFIRSNPGATLRDIYDGLGGTTSYARIRRAMEVIKDNVPDDHLVYTRAGGYALASSDRFRTDDSLRTDTRYLATRARRVAKKAAVSDALFPGYGYDRAAAELARAADYSERAKQWATEDRRVLTALDRLAELARASGASEDEIAAIMANA